MTGPAMESPTTLVQRQLEAYNAHDLARFLACYSESIAVYRMPATEPSLAGKAAFAAFYAEQRFNRPGLHADVLQRIAAGSTVVDHERVVGIADGAVDVIAVYEVKEGLIQNVWFHS